MELQRYVPCEIRFRGVRSREGEDWRPAIEGEPVCVWDLEVVREGRPVWIATMMSGPARADDYLGHVPAHMAIHRTR